MSFRKVLIIRLSSIGDIVLTSPVLRSVKKQTNAKIDYLIKDKYVHVIKNNPNINRVLTISEVLENFKALNYDLIIDLQKNFKSIFLSIMLKKNNTKYISYNKKNIHKWILINFKKNFILKEHIVDRYFNRLKKHNILKDNEGLDYFIPSDINNQTLPVQLPFNKIYYAWVIGGTYDKKKISRELIIEVCSKLSIPVFFLGGEFEKQEGDFICNSIGKSKNYNLCGLLSLDESAYVLKKASMVLSNDTGLLHIASAFNKKIISFWGCTRPSLGMAPYKPHSKNIQIFSNLSIFPCSKLGNRCSYNNKGCIKNITALEVLTAIHKIA